MALRDSAKQPTLQWKPCGVHPLCSHTLSAQQPHTHVQLHTEMDVLLRALWRLAADTVSLRTVSKVSPMGSEV